MRHNRERLGSLRGAPQRDNAPPLGGEPVKRACSNARRPLHPATRAPNEYTRLRLKAASYQSGLEIGLEITKHRNTEGNEPYDRPKWLGNHESSAERAKIGLPCNTEPDVSPAGVLQKGFQELGMPDLSSFPSHFRQRRGEKRRDCRSFVVFKPTRANEGMI